MKILCAIDRSTHARFALEHAVNEISAADVRKAVAATRGVSMYALGADSHVQTLTYSFTASFRAYFIPPHCVL